MDDLEVTPVSATAVLVQGPVRLQQWYDENTLDVPGAEYSRLYKQHKWDGKWYPAQWCRQIADSTYELRTSRGILPRLLNDLGYAQMALGGSVEAEMAQYISGQARWGELRDYQQEAFQSVVRSGWGRIAFATNAGKGAVIAMLADFAQRNAHSALILCDEKAVYDALQGELWEWAKIQPFLVKQGEHELPAPGVTLAMVQSLTKRLKDDPDAWKPWLAMQGMLLLDEADKATADTWVALCRGAKKSRWRAGFSGTFPEDRGYDDWRLEKLMGPILLRARNKELVERGISAKPLIELRGYDATIALSPLPSWDDWRAFAGPGRRQWAFEQAIMFNEHRHSFIATLVRPVPTAIIVNRVEHGVSLNRVIPGSVFLDGSISEMHRLTALEAFRKGKFHVLIVTKILDRGTNRLGFADDVIFASGEGSSRQTLQRIGRGLRRADGKAFLRLVDIIDRVDAVEGDDDRRLVKAADFIHEAGQKRVALYNEEGFDLEVIP